MIMFSFISLHLLGEGDNEKVALHIITHCKNISYFGYKGVNAKYIYYCFT